LTLAPESAGDDTPQKNAAKPDEYLVFIDKLGAAAKLVPGPTQKKWSKRSKSFGVSGKPPVGANVISRQHFFHFVTRVETCMAYSV
jgi:hypothetical protein